ncbi:MAG: hypothetical protein Q8Q01_00730 [archaeon]|nr:hypothetical protein [archaeon]
MFRKKDQTRSKYQAHPLVAILGKALLICSGNINVSTLLLLGSYSLDVVHQEQ